MNWKQIENDFAVEFSYYPNRKRKEIINFFKERVKLNSSQQKESNNTNVTADIKVNYGK